MKFSRPVKTIGVVARNDAAALFYFRQIFTFTKEHKKTAYFQAFAERAAQMTGVLTADF